jgi:hypothetical protein
MNASWQGLDTRKGQLQEMAAVTGAAKADLQAVLEDYPQEAHGSAWLEQAIGLVGQCEDEIDHAVAIQP